MSMIADRVSVLVTIDTEEDNWYPTKDGVSIENIRGVPEVQAIFDRHGIRPTYLTTYEVIKHPWAAEILGDIHRSNRGELGAHLHAWNTPPCPEPVTPETISLRTLPVEKQRAKLATLTEAIRSATGIRPTSFRAGRWSIAPTMVRVLAEAGYLTDSSVLPYVSWRSVPDGPRFFRAPPEPYRINGDGDVETPVPDGAIVEVPPTVGFTRWPWPLWSRWDRLARIAGLHPLHLPGVLARLGVLDRISLSLEATKLDRLLRLTDVALANDHAILNLFMHSVSLVPGWSPFVPTAADRDAFLERIDRYFTALRRRCSIEPVTLAEVGDRVRGTRPAEPLLSA
jgi:peptidoglycan/xylan/chitin deacetylase (PgdA/CDA1 family)